MDERTLSSYLPWLLGLIGVGGQFIRASSLNYRERIYWAGVTTAVTVAFFLTNEKAFPADWRLAFLQTAETIFGHVKNVVVAQAATALAGKAAVKLGADPSNPAVPATNNS